MMTIAELVERLAKHKTIGGAPRSELLWIAEHGTFARMAVGEVVSSHTEPVDGLKIILSGRLAFSADRGGTNRKVIEWMGGEVTGLLPYSRVQKPPGDTVVEEAVEVVSVDRADLPGFIANCGEVTAILVHVMLDRARKFTSTDLRDEKLLSLGKLAAGLAHELNNPASAAVRDSKSMQAVLNAAEDATNILAAAGLDLEQMLELSAVREKAMVPPNGPALSALELADREDALGEWLRSHGVDADLAAGLAPTMLATLDLDRLAGALPPAVLESSLRWICGGYAARMLAVNIERATSRIHALVLALKGFTRMDRPLAQEPVEVARGLRDSVALLEGKAKERQVQIWVSIPADLPVAWGIGVEINQIWMNLIDNAIDATSPKGHVRVEAESDHVHVVVRVIDDGPGIPADIRDRIFDPFFTTKQVGEGTGLGLDIVRRAIQSNEGEIEVDTQPGRTEFRVRLKLPPVGTNMESETKKA
jgi:signal transduction histidine kinase